MSSFHVIQYAAAIVAVARILFFFLDFIFKFHVYCIVPKQNLFMEYEQRINIQEMKETFTISSI